MTSARMSCADRDVVPAAVPAPEAATAVPFLDLVGVHAAIRQELDSAWATVLSHGHFVGGPEVLAFEQVFAEYCGAGGCVGVANSTDALELILTALGIGPGDEVIVPANTFVATVEAVVAVGARPRFVDVLPDTLLLDPAAVADAVNTHTAGVIVVHLYGQVADMDALVTMADRHGLALVEDAAHGAWFRGRSAGSFGAAAAFSFYPGKGLGDGGAILSDDADLLAQVRCLADHGRTTADHHRHAQRGRNSRLDTLQAALLTIKLRHLDAHNEARRAAMHRYRLRLPSWCVPVAVHHAAEPVFHLGVVRVPHRALVVEALTAAGVGWGVHYPTPCHRQDAYAEFAEALPVVEAAANQVVSLPLSPNLGEAQVDRVCDVLAGAL